MTSIVAESISWHVDGRAVVDQVDLELREGELVAIAGPNGAGKSTLLRLLAGELAPTTGRVLLDGRDLTSLSPMEQARLRAVMPQHTTLRFAFTVRQVTAMGRHPHPPSERDDSVVEEAMRAADVDELAERSFVTLSGGEQSLATIARIVAQEAPVLLLDEPTAHLDPPTAKALVDDVLAAAGDRAVLLVTHRPEGLELMDEVVRLEPAAR
jgi:iron complex transport system ATP-binding protein